MSQNKIIILCGLSNPWLCNIIDLLYIWISVLFCLYALNFIIPTGKSFKSAEETVFTENYARLTNVLNIHTLIPHLIQMNEVITTDDASDIRSCKRDSVKVMKLLEYVSHHLKAGCAKSFHIMLDIMKTYGTIADRELANEMESSLLANLSKGN